MLSRCLFLIVLISQLTNYAYSQSTKHQQSPHSERHARAISGAKTIVEQLGDRASAGHYIQLGDAHLRGGQCAEAVVAFEKALQLRPASRPYLWQYGIALYFVDRFVDGADLFQVHRVVNPNDVENAAWHFLCVAKSQDVKAARKLLLPAPGDRRPPMKEILARLPGGNFDGIRAAVSSFEDGPTRDSAEFYANLYIGLIADAEGDEKTAATAMQLSAKTEFTHYMADVARVYADHLAR